MRRATAKVTLVAATCCAWVFALNAQELKPESKQAQRLTQSQPPTREDVWRAATLGSMYPMSRVLETATDPKVARELRLSEAQRQVLTRLQELTQAAVYAAVSEIELDDSQSVDAQWDDLRRLASQARSEAVGNAEKIAAQAVLNARQKTRLQQILWQQMGVRSLLQDDVACALTLTLEQRDELRRLNQMALDYRGEALPEKRQMLISGQQHEETVHKPGVGEGLDFHVLIGRADARLLRVLSRQQREQWKDLLGPPFYSR